MLQAPFFDPNKTYEENWEQGPFNGFADGVVLPTGKPRFDFLGQKISYRLGIPAGPLLNGKFVKAALDKSFDVPVYKTVRSRVRACNPWPNVLGADITGDLTLEKMKEGVTTDKNNTMRNVMREDANPHESGIYTEKMLEQAPAREGNYIKVKKIL